ncbi:MAG: hypothetical protein FXF49_01730 [Flexistipes sinusarabici]|uniref:Uncharacterized protein n=1 Tax=Flexistipes sinusarabici TaxID=2352 RepID=A0A5D0MT41_FLESI|nr:hypothetical protein [Flexistipes sinusarabici]TYB34989.1 MAG: hypothetical protein FXF49_01730 [Flexistipes sinusarabici]
MYRIKSKFKFIIGLILASQSIALQIIYIIQADNLDELIHLEKLTPIIVLIGAVSIMISGVEKTNN